jgi:ASC-1-like (ASCH) protein
VRSCLAVNAFASIPVLKNGEDIAPLIKERELKYGDEVIFEDEVFTINNIEVRKNGDYESIKFKLEKRLNI